MSNQKPSVPKPPQRPTKPIPEPGTRNVPGPRKPPPPPPKRNA